MREPSLMSVGGRDCLALLVVFVFVVPGDFAVPVM